MKCDYLLPAHDVVLTPRHEMVQCLREKGHQFDHFSLLPDGRCILWALSSPLCGCDDEDCGCFDYSEVSSQEAQEILDSFER